MIYKFVEKLFVVKKVKDYLKEYRERFKFDFEFNKLYRVVEILWIKIYRERN